MAIASVAQLYKQKQDAVREDSLEMNRRLTLRFARQLVREFADRMDEGYYLDPKDLPEAEKKLLLMFAVDDTDTYEFLIQNPTRLQAGYQEYKKEMQYWIDEVIEDVYQEEVLERRFEDGFRKEYDRTNGETIWIRN